MLSENAKTSPLYSPDLAPLEGKERNWGTWDLAALWVGIAVCIPTYLLASYMLKSGLNWFEAVCIIGLGNLIITLPMVLNGHAGVKYGLPFPVIGRAAFGTSGVHIATLLRGAVACGWFGIQTWIGGISIYVIGCTLIGAKVETGLCFGQFIGFGLFWLINIYFVWKGTEQIKWLEAWSAPILILVGLLLIGWGWQGAGSFGVVLEQSRQLSKQTAVIQTVDNQSVLKLAPVEKSDGTYRVDKFRVLAVQAEKDTFRSEWVGFSPQQNSFPVEKLPEPIAKLYHSAHTLSVEFQTPKGEISGIAPVQKPAPKPEGVGAKLWQYLLWLTAMVGFWATMSISISDVTRHAKDQKSQIWGQFIGLPTTMGLYSFVGIFVTCAALLNFENVLIVEEAPWDPVRLLARFDSPVVVILAQLTMLLATLSTNIAANIIAPAVALTNLFPRRLNMQTGGVLAGALGVLVCPWWLMDSISDVLILVSGLLGPILGVLIADYFVIHRTNLDLEALYDPEGKYKGVSTAGLLAMLIGMGVVALGLFVPSLGWLYNLAWFVGFAVGFVGYWRLKRVMN